MSLRRWVWRLYLLVSGATFFLVVFLLSAFAYNTYFSRYETVVPAYPESKTTADRSWSTDDPDVVRILAINGGALLGIADLEVLKAIEDAAGRPVHELFDFVTGSSTGAIIGTLLLLPQEGSGKPRDSEQAAKVYEEFSASVLSSPFWHRVLTLNGTIGPLFTNAHRIEVAQNLFGNATFGELIRPAMFPAFINNRNEYQAFRNWKHDNSGLLLSSLLTGVTSAPIMFPAVKFAGYEETETIVTDPGFVLSAPAHIAYIKAREEQPRARRFVVVTLSTVGPSHISENAMLHGGAAQLVRTLTNIMFAGQMSLTREELAAHSKFGSDVEIQSFELQPVVNSHRHFDASPDNVAAIRASGVAYAKQNADLIKTIVTALQTSGIPR